MSILFSKKKKKIFLILDSSFTRENIIILANIPRKRAKKLMSIMATSMQITIAKKKAFKNVETGENSVNSKNGDKDENLKTSFL